MKFTTQEVLQLLTSELQASGHQPTAVEVAQMRSFLVGLSVSPAAGRGRIARRLVAHRRRRPMFLVQGLASPPTLVQDDPHR